MSEIEISTTKELVGVGMRSKYTPVIAKPHMGGWQLVFRFPNRYGASLVIGTTMAYGGLELAVAVWLDGDEGDDDFHLSYDTPITDNVLGYLTRDDLEPILDAIYALAPFEVPLGAPLALTEAMKAVSK